MLTICHNPRCSKSRETLALLEEKGLAPKVRRYLDEPLSAKEIRALLKKLALPASGLVRRKEALWDDLKLDGATEKALIEAMAANPSLIERPVVETRSRAAIGRPPEAALAIL